MLSLNLVHRNLITFPVLFSQSLYSAGLFSIGEREGKREEEREAGKEGERETDF